LCYLDAHNHPLDAQKDALQVSTFITNGPTLPRDNSYEGSSLAASDFRVQVGDVEAPSGAFATLESRTRAGTLRAALNLPLTRPAQGLPLRSAYVRLVADETDNRARGAETRTLRVALRDYVLIRYRSGERTYEARLRVGQPGVSSAGSAARQARLHVHVLRAGPEGAPLIGRNDTEALALMRSQLVAANEIWLQCNLSFGDPAETAMEVVAPPPPTLIAIANDDGLPAQGGGEIRLQVNGETIASVRTQRSARPLQTAQAIARALTLSGFHAVVTENLSTRSGAGPGADVVVRRQSGAFVTVEPVAGIPLTTDARQSVRIGRVDLGDGLQEFDNMTAQVGSLEERTLIKAIGDEDPQSIDIFVVNHFTGATRQGEAFIADPTGAIINAVVIDRNGLKHAPLAWTLAHELGHVLMNDPLHPDNVGPDRPWLLMDADSGRGTVDGPKRLRPQDCSRMREIAKHAEFPLLLPFDTVDDEAVSAPLPP
jgi:hypothetical protein